MIKEKSHANFIQIWKKFSFEVFCLVFCGLWVRKNDLKIVNFVWTWSDPSYLPGFRTNFEEFILGSTIYFEKIPVKYLKLFFPLPKYFGLGFTMNFMPVPTPSTNSIVSPSVSSSSPPPPPPTYYTSTSSTSSYPYYSTYHSLCTPAFTNTSSSSSSSSSSSAGTSSPFLSHPPYSTPFPFPFSSIPHPHDGLPVNLSASPKPKHEGCPSPRPFSALLDAYRPILEPYHFPPYPLPSSSTGKYYFMSRPIFITQIKFIFFWPLDCRCH